MSRIMFLGPLGTGHINPTLGTAEELVRRGHAVTYAAPTMFADAIRATGAKFVPVTSTWEAMGRDTLPQMHGAGLVDAMGLLLVETRTMVDALIEQPAPDVVVHDGTLTWWGRVLAHRWSVPAIESWPNLVSNEHWNMNRYTRLNPLSPRFLLTMLRIARYLRTQGITDVAGFLQGASAAQRLVTVPRAFQPAGETFTDGWQFVGPILGDRTYQGEWEPPSDQPVLLVSLGTAYNDRPEFFRMVARSAAGRPWRVVMAVGDLVDVPALGELPANVEVHEQVPQLAVLRHATAFVTHAGMGSTLEALAIGVPLVALPQMAEQRANADRIAELALGRAINPDTVTASGLWEAIDEVIGSALVAERLAWMRDQIRESGGSTAAADVVEGVLAAS